MMKPRRGGAICDKLNPHFQVVFVFFLLSHRNSPIKQKNGSHAHIHTDTHTQLK